MISHKHERVCTLRDERSRVVKAAKTKGGCIVVDKEGQRLFSIWIPQTPVSDD